jgi:peptidoglycan-associated lipoprotein
MKVFSKLCLAVTPLVLLVACASTQEKAATPEQPSTEQRTAPAAQPEATPTPAPDHRLHGSPLEDPNSPLSKRTIYFDFDKADIKPEFRPILQAHAEYLSANPSVKIVLEGNTDERGTREYNMGLGERRAKAVKSFLTLQGVRDSQLQTVSYGEERPVSMCSAEECWSLNRRVEIVYR